MSDFKKFTQANREAWNEAMPHHQKANAGKWDKAFETPGFSVINEPELSLINSLNIEGQKIAHVCCNNGVELMSLKNLGAGECIGFDISDAAIQEAQERASRFGIACEFVQTDIYDIPEKYHGEFDIVYISIGCLGWMPGIQRFFGKVTSLLNESGELFIYEAHPFSEMLPSDDLDNVDPLKIIEPCAASDQFGSFDLNK
ncbi:MAG: class I SAM-dependent methyltransferase [Candidatus Marinimicrobia bacterium]|nr:class I SAM-dependent methyltransferase [Candidatus Neomarinimicrobiota bacterium]